MLQALQVQTKNKLSKMVQINKVVILHVYGQQGRHCVRKILNIILCSSCSFRIGLPRLCIIHSPQGAPPVIDKYVTAHAQVER